MLNHRSPSRRPAVISDGPPLTIPPTFFIRPARLVWKADGEFIEIRQIVGAYYAALDPVGGTPKEACQSFADPGLIEAHSRWMRACWDCDALATHHFAREPKTVRDIFLRSELLTMHFGRGQIADLKESDCMGQRMLGGLLEACWKVGGAANV